jgi:Methyltransferase domain
VRLRRYEQLTNELRTTRCDSIIEVGTWNGQRAKELARAALHASEHVHYDGFDLFENLTPAEREAELSKTPPTQRQVETELQDFQRAVQRRNRLVPWRRNRSFSFTLHRGYTRDTLPAFRRERPGARAGFIWIDGGHKTETIASDWENCRHLIADSGVIYLDDYYGNAHLAKEFGCNQLVARLQASEEWNVDVLPIADDIPDMGTIRIVRVTKADV